MEFFTGMLVGFIVAGLIGRAKFLQVQNALRDTRTTLLKKLDDLYARIRAEENLVEGLSQELADRTR